MPTTLGYCGIPLRDCPFSRRACVAGYRPKCSLGVHREKIIGNTRYIAYTLMLAASRKNKRHDQERELSKTVEKNLH